MCRACRQYVINGSMRVGVYDGAGKVYEYEVGPGDVGFVPRGAGETLSGPFFPPAFHSITQVGNQYAEAFCEVSL